MRPSVAACSCDRLERAHRADPRPGLSGEQRQLLYGERRSDGAPLLGGDVQDAERAAHEARPGRTRPSTDRTRARGRSFGQALRASLDSNTTALPRRTAAQEKGELHWALGRTGPKR